MQTHEKVLLLVFVVILLVWIAVLTVLHSQLSDTVSDIPDPVLVSLLPLKDLVTVSTKPLIPDADNTVPLFSVPAPSNIVEQGQRAFLDMSISLGFVTEKPLDPTTLVRLWVDDGFEAYIGALSKIEERRYTFTWSGCVMFSNERSSTEHSVALKFPDKSGGAVTVVVAPLPGLSNTGKLCVVRV